MKLGPLFCLIPEPPGRNHAAPGQNPRWPWWKIESMPVMSKKFAMISKKCLTGPCVEGINVGKKLEDSIKERGQK